MNAYQLAVTISLLPLASLGEIYGYRRVYHGGLVVFTVASLVCALSIVAADADHRPASLQGFGAAGIMSVNSALIRFIYPRRWLGRGRRAERDGRLDRLGGRADGGRRRSWRSAHWPWLFAVNVPLGIGGR